MQQLPLRNTLSMLNNTFLPGYLSQSENFEELPTQSDVVIIGGGIAGCSALYHLAKMGCTDVLLLERDEPISVIDASGTAIGIVSRNNVASMLQVEQQ